MPIIHVSLAFAKAADPKLDDFASNVVMKMTGNTSYPTPVVSLAALGVAQGAFHTALATSLHNGTLATAAKSSARAALVALLRQEAADVEATAAGDLVVLLSSGYVQRGTPGPSTALVKPVIAALTNGHSTQLIAHVTPQANAKSYEAQVRIGTGAWQTVVIATKARSIVLPGLIPGTMYDVQVRAIGGVSGYSDWSDPVSHMCM